MPLPAIFGSWEQFVENWCANSAPHHNREAVEAALSTLMRLWPERIMALASNRARGLLLINPAIRDGIMLSACEDLKGFDNVIRRLRQDAERSAYCELAFTARVVRAGLTPVLEPRLGSKILDTLI